MSGEGKMVMPNNNRRQNARNFIAHPGVYLPTDQRPRFVWPSHLYRCIVNQPPGADEALRRNQQMAYNPSVVNGR
ncbi:uncharacterized protein LOC116265423 isoform X2 [Nymphaea colorata]|nr:uncharacterized protein LOC116265423 isoform X2 [Nymphaea colorata]